MWRTLGWAPRGHRWFLAESEKWREADARGHGEVTVDQEMMLWGGFFVTLWKTF